MNNIITRVATLDDVSGIMPIFAQVVAYHKMIDPQVYTDADMNAFLECVREHITTEGWTTFVAEKDDKIIGFLALKIRRNRRQFGNVKDIDGWVDCLGVDENCRHMGIGTKLIETMEEYLKQQGIDEFRLTVSVYNSDAIKCYEKLGMETFLYQMRKELK